MLIISEYSTYESKCKNWIKPVELASNSNVLSFDVRAPESAAGALVLVIVTVSDMN